MTIDELNSYINQLCKRQTDVAYDEIPKEVMHMFEKWFEYKTFYKKEGKIMVYYHDWMAFVRTLY